MKTELRKSERLAWSSQPEKIELVNAEGSFLYDSNGKRYIDLVMGWCVGNFGWKNEKIMDAIREFSGPTYVYPEFEYRSWAELADLLCRITPGRMGKCFRTTGGTDAVETAIKVSALYTGRKKFLSVENSYHGNSLAALSIGAASSKDTYPKLTGCDKIAHPPEEGTLEKTESYLKTKDYAAFILEPVMTHPRIVDLPADYLRAVRELCSKYGTLLVADEVAVGFGRTGKLFACEHSGIEPDIICLAKALSGGHAAIGAALTTEEIGAKVEEEISAYPTYGWHPLSTQVSLAAMNYLLDNEKELLKNANSLSDFFRTRLKDMKFRNKQELSIKGLAVSVDVKEKDYAKEIVECALEKGLVLEHHGSSLVMFPALTLKRETAVEAMDILMTCI
ncbi:MAG: aspartate aminotransferase family protein [Bacteroidia bacterium]